MRAIVTDQVALFVFRSVTAVSPTEMAEPIKMLFRLKIRVGPRNYVSDAVKIPCRKGQF